MRKLQKTSGRNLHAMKKQKLHPVRVRLKLSTKCIQFINHTGKTLGLNAGQVISEFLEDCLTK
jgi:ribosomal protein L28